GPLFAWRNLQAPPTDVQRERYGKHRTTDPARGHRSRHERQGHEPLQGERGKHRERPRDRRPDDDIGGVCRVAHGEICEPTRLSMQAILNTTLPASLNTCAVMLRAVVS